MSPEIVGQIRDLACYPIKSAARVQLEGGQELQRAILTPEGIETVEGVRDHQFMVVRAVPDDQGVYNFVTQRDKRDKADKPQGLSVLALIKPQIRGGDLLLTWNGEDQIGVPLDYDGGQEIPVRIWKDVCKAVDQGDYLSEWLGDHLGIQARLVKAGSSFRRRTSQSYMTSDNQVRLQDGYPIHWFPIESVEELKDKAEEVELGAGGPISWHSFRPQVVAEGMQARVEHQILRGSVSGIPFIDPKPCDRCSVTLVDQQTGERRGPEPLRTLATYKKWRNNNGELKVIFGENMNPGARGEIAIGDEIVATELRDPPLHYGAKV